MRNVMPSWRCLTIFYGCHGGRCGLLVQVNAEGSPSNAYAGAINPPILTTPGNTVTIEFKTDDSVQRKGWLLKYRAVGRCFRFWRSFNYVTLQCQQASIRNQLNYYCNVSCVYYGCCARYGQVRRARLIAAYSENITAK